MEKMRLTVDDLAIQSFATTRLGGQLRGTVRGHDAPTDPVECPTANPEWDTCADTCWGSCPCSGNSCNGCGSDGCGGFSDWACTNGCHTGYTVTYC
jgi:hypothetical protein